MENADVTNLADQVRYNADATGQIQIDGPMTSAKFVTNNYNNPMGLYSDANVVNTLADQTDVAGFKNQVKHVDGSLSPAVRRSKVLQAIDQEKSRSPSPRRIAQTKSFQYLG